jgi:hypothetical protein
MARTQQPGELTVVESLQLLSEVSFGRVVFTSRALPAVKAVRHVLSGTEIVIAAGPELVFGAPPQPADSDPGPRPQTIVAYEADQLDATGRSGWSVVVVGRARPITDKDELSRYRRLLPSTTVPDQLVGISADVVSGFRLVSEDEAVTAPH